MRQKEQVLMLLGSPRQSPDNRHGRSHHASELWPLARDWELLILLFLRSSWDDPSAVFQSKRIKTRSGAVTRSGLHQEGHFRPLSRPSYCQGDCETRDTGERGQAEDTFSDEVGGREQREIGALQFHPEQRHRESQSWLLGPWESPE